MERISFVADDDAVDTIIRSQHTDLAKALMELIMNCIDSGARVCTILLTHSGFSVVDDGKGFGSYDDVMVRFKRLGKAHKNDAPTYGRFGMGRGQIMVWGRIEWASGIHRMVTDLNAYTGFDYKPDIEIAGCSVKGTFYDPLSQYDFLRVQRTLAQQCRFIDSSITIRINNRTVNTADDEVWDEETDDYRIRWYQDRGETRPISLYNQGVFICNLIDRAAGLGADVVTKRAMTLNMARNSIDPKDPLWQTLSARINDKIRQHRRSTQTRTSMNEDRRLPLIDALVQPCEEMSWMMLGDWGETFAYDPCSRLPLLRDSRGRYQRFETLANRPLTVVPVGREREAEALAIQKLAVPVTIAELRRWNVDSGEDLINLFNNTAAKRLWAFMYPEQPPGRFRLLQVDARVVDFDEITRNLNTSNALLKPKDLKPAETAARKACDYASGVMAGRLGKIDQCTVRKRRIVLGESLFADGWTDACNYIAINRKMVPVLDRGLAGATQLALLLLHEYVHDKDNPDCDEHGELFYERFHDLASDYSKNELVGTVARGLWQRYLVELNRKGLPLPTTASGHSEANRAFVITLALGEGGLSAFARELLEKSRLHFSLRGRTLILKSSVDFLYARTDSLRGWVLRQIPDGLETLPPHYKAANAFTASHMPDTEQERDERRNAVAKAWANETGGHPGSYLAACKLFERRMGQNPMDQLVAFLVNDPGTHLLHYESSPRVPAATQAIGGPGYTLRLTDSEYHGFGQYGKVVEVNGDSVRKNPDARASFVMDRVCQAIRSITNPEERAAIIATLQSDEFARELAARSPDD